MDNQITETARMVATIRNMKRMSQVELAGKSEVPHSYISRFEAGIFVLPDRHIQALERALGVDLDEIRPVFQQLVALILSGPGDGHTEEVAR